MRSRTRLKAFSLNWTEYPYVYIHVNVSQLNTITGNCRFLDLHSMILINGGCVLTIGASFYNAFLLSVKTRVPPLNFFQKFFGVCFMGCLVIGGFHQFLKSKFGI